MAHIAPALMERKIHAKIPARARFTVLHHHDEIMLFYCYLVFLI